MIIHLLQPAGKNTQSPHPDKGGDHIRNPFFSGLTKHRGTNYGKQTLNRLKPPKLQHFFFILCTITNVKKLKIPPIS